jgi:hypothetical protein
MPQALGVVHTSERTEYGLSQHSGECMPIVLASPRVGEHIARHRRQLESAVEFTIGERPGARRDDRPPELKRQSAVEIEPECPQSF